jgi:hypothetical protein
MTKILEGYNINRVKPRQIAVVIVFVLSAKDRAIAGALIPVMAACDRC